MRCETIDGRTFIRFDDTPRLVGDPVDLLNAALGYAAAGLQVFPLAPGSKKPHRGSHGFKDATCDEAVIRAWWALSSESNVGIATGGLVEVIDVDGPAGQAVMDHLRALADPPDGPRLMPAVLGEVTTPRGRHLYVRPCGLGCRVGWWPEVDTRGAGGYVVAPPSVVAGHVYEWFQPLDLGEAEP